MSYTTPDFADTVIELLKGAGYTVHGRRNDDEDEGIPYESDEIDEIEDDAAGVFWFTWAAPGTDIEVGEDRDSPLEAWGSALAHRIQNSAIPVFTGAQSPDTVPCTLTYTDLDMRELICTAVEGGINYWCDVGKRTRAPREGSDIPDYTGFEADIIDGPVACDHPEIEAAEIGRFTVDTALMRQGIRRLLAPGAAVSPSIRNDVLLLGLDHEHSPDADSADAIVQFAVFGEIVFG